MLDHITIKVSDIGASRAFYERALAPLGLKVLFQDGDGLGYGSDRPFFWIAPGTVSGPLHIAFAAAAHPEVDAFHAAAIAAGGTDNGPPGPRPQYHPHYYGAFVLDPDGNNIEAVCQTAQLESGAPFR